MANEVTAAELVANIRVKMDALQGDMAKAEQIIQSGAKNMQNGANTAGTGIGAKLGGGIKTGLSSLLGGGAGMLLGGAIAGGVVLLTKEVIGTASELAELGRQSDRVGASFTQLWGSEAPDAIARLRDASQGTIADMDLMLAANRANKLEVGSGIGDLVKLMQVAQDRGRAMGLTTAQAFSDIVTGIGRMSPMILDNLGIVMDAENTYAAYAESLGKSADALTDVEKKQALVDRVTAEAGDVAMDSAGKHEALQAAKENLRAQIGGMIDAWVEETGVVDNLTESLNRQAKAIDERGQRGADIADEQARLDSIMLSIAAEGVPLEYTGQFADLQQDIDKSSEAFVKGTKSLYDYQSDMNGFMLRLRTISGETYPELIHRGEQWDSALRIQKQATDSAAVAAANLAAREAELASQGVAGAAGAELAAQKIRLMGDRSEEAAAKMAKLTREAWSTWMAIQAAQGPYQGNEVNTSGMYPVYSSALELAQARIAEGSFGTSRGYQGALDEQKSYADKSIDIAQEQFDRLRGIVESSLSPTAVTAADLAATAAGTYVDKWDEYMRRVRMPESGMGADQIAEQERLFYSGQMLDQINWGSLVSDVQRKVQEEAGKESMIQEAMRQVAAAGIGASQSQVAEAMGITGYGAGASEEKQIARGLTAAGLGVKFTEEFEKEFREQQQRWVDMGTLSVSWMATGMERGTTPQVTGLLIGLLAPRIAEILMGTRP